MATLEFPVVEGDLEHSLGGFVQPVVSRVFRTFVEA